MTPKIYRHPHGITAVDTEYLYPGHAAAHIIEDAGRAAFVDVGTNYSVPHLLDALRELGIAREAVDYVFLTHVHLDHCGGAGRLMQELPNAVAVLHPRGAAHVIDPQKVIAGSKAVYGEERFNRLYGELSPIPVARVRTAEDGERFRLGGRELELIHTPGHALHHYAVVDVAHASIFPGDTFGVSYRELDCVRGAFITPATTPTQFDPDQLVASIDRMIGYAPESMYLMHFSRVTDLARLAASLKAQITELVRIAQRHAGVQDRYTPISADMLNLWLGLAHEQGVPISDAAIAKLLQNDLDLNTQGLIAWLDRKEAELAVMPSFKAFRIHEQDQKIVARFEQLTLDDLATGEVVVRVLYSDINYKDALAATGAGKILRRYPLVGGIDLAGVVESSTDSRYAKGDAVLVTGCALSETHDGGYAEYARVKGDWVIPMPPGLDAFAAMALGTAGFTAGLAIHRMEHNGQTPQQGPIVVTRKFATGGVGSIAIDMLTARGYEVIAVSGKAAAADYLRSLGATRILARQEINFGSRPLESVQFAGAIDNVGGEMLTWLTRTVDFWGNIASVGLAASAELKTTVMPFILRAVSLLGINTSATPRDIRLAVWKRIATDLRPRHLDRIVTRTISFDELPGAFPAYIEGGIVGRTVVKIG